MVKEKKCPKAIYNCPEDKIDLTFIVNEAGRTLKDRFEQLIKDCKFFDCLVAYLGLMPFISPFKELRK